MYHLLLSLTYIDDCYTYYNHCVINLYAHLYEQISHKDELHHQLEQYKLKQKELENYMATLEKHQQNLSASQKEVCTAEHT